MRLDTLTREAFEDTHGGTVQLRVGPTWEPVAIAEARALASPSPRAAPPFAVVLRGAFPLSQGLHALRHPVLGELDLFLVPVGRDREGWLYEAVFN